MDKKAKGKTYLEQVLAKLPEEKRTKFQELLAEDVVLEEIGGGTLRQEDYSRLATEAQQAKTTGEQHQANNNRWYQDNLKALTEGQLAIARLKELDASGGGTTRTDPNPPAPAAVDLTGYVKEADARKLVEQAALQVPGFVAAVNTVMFQHQQEFGEVLNVTDLYAHCHKIGLPIDAGGYENFVKEKREAKRQEKYKLDIAEAEKRGEERARTAGAPTPYPVDPSEPTVLGILGMDVAKRESEFGVAAAAREYNEGLRKARSA